MGNSLGSIHNPFKEIRMKLMTALAVFALSTGLAWAAGDAEKKAPSPAQKAQQEKMKSCNAEAGKQSLKGD